jgi:hypothetical protein
MAVAPQTAVFDLVHYNVTAGDDHEQRYIDFNAHHSVPVQINFGIVPTALGQLRINDHTIDLGSNVPAEDRIKVFVSTILIVPPAKDEDDDPATAPAAFRATTDRQITAIPDDHRLDQQRLYNLEANLELNPDNMDIASDLTPGSFFVAEISWSTDYLEQILQPQMQPGQNSPKDAHDLALTLNAIDSIRLPVRFEMDSLS